MRRSAKLREQLILVQMKNVGHNLEFRRRHGRDLLGLSRAARSWRIASSASSTLVLRAEAEPGVQRPKLAETRGLEGVPNEVGRGREKGPTQSGRSHVPALQ